MIAERSSRIDTIAPALLIGFIAFAIEPAESVLVGWALGSWLVLTLLAIVVLALARQRTQPATAPGGTDNAVDASIRERVMDALANKAALLREAGRTEEAISVYDELIRSVDRRMA